MSTNLYFVVDNRKPDRLGKSPLKLRISHNRTMSDIPMNVRLLEGEWDEKRERIKTTSKSFDNVTRLNNQLQSRRARYLDQINELEEQGILEQLKARQVKERLVNKLSKVVSLYEFIDQHIELKSDIEGTQKTFIGLKRKLQKFSGDSNKDLSFADITYDFLERLEHDHLRRGYKYSSLSVYLRALRSLYNKAIKVGLAKRSSYPFTDYSIKKGEPSRRALSLENFEKLINAKFKEGSAEQIGKDYYLASFYLQGMNWMDMCLLRYENFVNVKARVQYIRRKTGGSYNILAIDKVIEIINRLKPINLTNPKDFVFPVLDLECKDSFRTKRILNRRLKINKYLHRIAANLSIPKFSIYSARHTYATFLYEKTGTVSLAQLSLGHKTEQQTQDYLSSFGNKRVDDAAEDLFNDF